MVYNEMLKQVRLVLRVEELEDSSSIGVAEVDPEIMEKFGINSGDLLLVEGEQETAVIVRSGREEDRGREVIRLNKLSMKTLESK